MDLVCTDFFASVINCVHLLKIVNTIGLALICYMKCFSRKSMVSSVLKIIFILVKDFQKITARAKNKTQPCFKNSVT